MPLRPTPSFADTFELAICTCTGANNQDGCKAPGRLAALSVANTLTLLANQPPNSCMIMECVDNIDGLGKPSGPFTHRQLFSLFFNHLMATHKENRSHNGGIKRLAWAIPLEGIRKLLNSEFMKGILMKGRDPMVRQIHTIFPLAIDMVWQDSRFLREKGIHADILRMYTVYFLCSMADEGPLHKYFMNDKTIDLIWACWLETLVTPEKILPTRSYASRMVSRMLGDGRGPHIVSMAQRLLSAASHQYVASKMVQWLKDDRLLNDELNQEMKAMSVVLHVVKATGQNSSLAPFLDAGIHFRACRAMHRQLSCGSDDRVSTLKVVVSTAFVTMSCLYGDEPNAPTTLFEILEKASFGVCFSKVLFLLHSGHPDLDSKTLNTAFDTWSFAIHWIKHASACRESDCWLRGSPEMLDLARQNFEGVYVRTWSELMKVTESPLGDKPLLKWRELCDYFELTDNSTRERHKFLRRCCNINCPQTITGRKGMKKFCCSKCETVFYCGEICQKADWGKHKTECDPAHFSTYERIRLLYPTPPIPSDDHKRYSSDF